MGVVAHLLRGMRGRLGAMPGCLLLLAACAGTETGNPPASTEVDVLPSDRWEGPPYFDTEVLDAAPRLGSTTISFARVEALPVGTCAALQGDPGAAVRGAVELPFQEDLGFEVPSGQYCGVRLFPRLTSADDSSVPPLLVDHSLLFELRDLQGASYVLVRSQRVTPFVLLADAADPEAFFDVPTPGLRAVLALDAASALIALRFWESPAQDDGSYVFDEMNGAEFLRAFEAYPGLLRIYIADVRGTGIDAGMGATPPLAETSELARTP